LFEKFFNFIFLTLQNYKYNLIFFYMWWSHRYSSHQIDTSECLISMQLESWNYFYRGELFFIAFREIDLRSLISPIGDFYYKMGINPGFCKYFSEVIILPMNQWQLLYILKSSCEINSVTYFRIQFSSLYLYRFLSTVLLTKINSTAIFFYITK